MNTSCSSCQMTVNSLREGQSQYMLRLWEEYGVDSEGETCSYVCEHCSHRYDLTIFTITTHIHNKLGKYNPTSTERSCALEFTPRILNFC